VLAGLVVVGPAVVATELVVVFSKLVDRTLEVAVGLDAGGPTLLVGPASDRAAVMPPLLLHAASAPHQSRATSRRGTAPFCSGPAATY
jgi:hypothetical protein